MSITTVTELIDALRQNHLVMQQKLCESLSELPRFQNPKDLAKEMLERGALTAFQINHLFSGRGRDLHLGQYLLLERLGEGGMGQVFRAIHQGLNREVALKVIHPERLTKEDALNRFHREMQIVAKLSHPNFVLGFDANEINGKHFIVMEYIEGIDLARLVKLWGPLKIPLACEYIRQTGIGLQYAFEHRLVHRDIKPSNLLVTYPSPGRVPGGFCPGVVASGQVAGMAASIPVVKILDMGLARVYGGPEHKKVSTLTQEGAVVGTPDFIPPEQARDARTADIRSDLYSLGCTFYYLLTARVPFRGGTVISKLMRHQHEHPDPIQRWRPEVPLQISTMVQKLMAKDPQDRYQTPADLVSELARLLSVDFSSHPVSDPDPGTVRPQQQLGESGPHWSSIVTPSSSAGKIVATVKWRRMWEEHYRSREVAIGVLITAVVAVIGILIWMVFRNND